MVGTIWALIPPVIAIGLALITKEVYLSLMVGIASGALMFEHFQPVEAMNTIFEIMTGKIGSNCDILIFLVMLGILVALITKSGASRAYGKWALKAIKSKRQAMFVFLIFLMILNADFSKMKRYEEEKGNETHDQKHEADVPVVGKGQVKDLILPILFLIASCIGFMLYTGGFFEGKDIITALSECSSGRSLVLGSFSTLIFTFLLYIPRKVVAFVDFCGSFSQGFKSMTSAIMILCLAWTLSGICGEEYLRIGQFVSGIISGNTSAAAVLPALFFLAALGLSFATGTSWGTFGILIPISVAVVGNDISALTLLVGSILSGAVCGDHISPISDTTILASAGAGCRHIDHVATQMPYALIVAVCAVVGYLTAGALGNGFLGLAVAAGALAVAMASIVWNLKKKA